MKKVIFAIAAAAMVFASCQKEELSDNSNSVAEDIKLSVTVAEPGSDDPATKAKIKSGWSSGDVISIYYDASTEKAFDITYDGSKWTSNNITNPGSARGKVKCLYNGTLKVASTDDYVFADDELTFNIENWKFLTGIQVVVSGLSSDDAANYTLACDKFAPLSDGGFAVGEDAITATLGTPGTPVTGIANADGAAFVFATADYSDSEQNLLFTLTDTTDPLATRKVKGYSFNETITDGTSQIKAYKISADKFQESVRLWYGGPLWAYSNIGAESATGYGYYFAWGHTDGYVYNGSSWVKASDPSSSITFDRTGYPNYKTDPYSDMARANWGEDWKVPTKTDFDNLLSKCDVEYVTTGAPGIKITGKGDYSANSIFIPAAGYCADSGLGSEGNGGFYYSATEVDSDDYSFAYALYFYLDQGTAWVANNKKFCGRSVRPIRNFITFADAAFKACCVENFDTNSDGEISPEEAQAVTAIDCSGKNITSLVGIEYFTNLDTLNCSDNTSLTTIDVSSHTSLTTLNISGNTSLTTIDCNNGIHIVAGAADKPISSISAQWAYVDDEKAVFFTFNGRVKAMSADETTNTWGHIGETTDAYNDNDGASNTDKIVGGAFWSSGAIWCRKKGSMWYQPAKNEMIAIYNNISSLNSALSLADGTQLEAFKYWTSNEDLDDYYFEAWYVDLSTGKVDVTFKSVNLNIRAIRSL